MRFFTTLLFALFFFTSYSHEGEFVSINRVSIYDINDKLNIDFDLINEKDRSLNDITIVLFVNNLCIDTLYVSSIKSSQKRTTLAFQVNETRINQQSDFIQIKVTELFGRKYDWCSWDNGTIEKQVNTLASEFYADAPWRMNKLDPSGNLQGIPVHFFLHDADEVPGLDVQVDNINIQIKNATDGAFGPVLRFDTLTVSEFQAYFSCLSELDTDLDIKAFNLNSFSTSNSQTIDFDIDSDFFGDFAAVDTKYWYFTFTIPPRILEGYNDIVDILVTLEYSNFTLTDDKVGLRVFRTDEDMPTLTHFYRGDTHLHSMYTQNDAEIGLPLCATKKAASLAGLNWVTTTDHTSDYDNYGSSISSNWARIQSEAASLNLDDPSFIYIPGLEVALNNSQNRLVHMLAYPNPELPGSMPYLGDGNGDLIPTSSTINGVLSDLTIAKGFAYMAHPFATGDKLPDTPVNGGIWNLGQSDFPANGSGFPLDGGTLICNDLTLPSDVLLLQGDTLIKEGIKGGQIWNSRYNLIATGDQNDPWNIQGNTSAFGQMDTLSEEFHIRRFRQGQEIVNHINQLGLQYKNLNPAYSNWKLFYSAGSDAHGSFNYANTDDFAGLGKITNNAVGKISTVTYCPQGMGANGENVLDALKNGRTTLSDGPLLSIGFSTHGANQPNDVFMGQDTILDANQFPQTYLNIDYATSSEFGTATHLRVYLGTETGEMYRDLPVSATIGSTSVQYKLSDLLDSILGIGNTPVNEYMYLRAELKTLVDYSGMLSQYKTNYDIFHSIANPIWFNHYNNVGLDHASNQTIVSYPNPVENTLHFSFEQFSSFSIHILDETGRIVMKTEGEGSSGLLNVSHLSKGMYTANVQLGERNYRVKFIKL